jgi:hypothetical protein
MGVSLTLQLHDRRQVCLDQRAYPDILVVHIEKRL